jgi:steroid 5-alpha reductase family enzyme
MAAPRGTFTKVALAYAVAAAAAVAAGFASRGLGPIWAAAIGDVAATAVIFAGSALANNSSLYDPYWSIAPPFLAGHWIAVAPAGVPPLRLAIAGGLVAVWGARLTWNWVRRWGGFSDEDWRYLDLRRSTGRAYWLVSFLGLHLFPTAIVFLACLPLHAALALPGRAPSALDALGLALGAGGIALEALADQQLHRFLRGPRDASRGGALLEGGVWAWSRHPNSAGENLFWWGLAALGAAAGAPWWYPAGALAISAMFVFVSVPMIERRMESRRPGYRDRRRGVPSLALWPPRRRAD